MSALPPVERGAAGMTRRNYLVERNRLRVAASVEERKAYEAQELKAAEQRRAEKLEKQQAWQTQQKQLSATADRPLPGGGPRSQRMKNTAQQRSENTYQLEKQREAEKKAEYNRLYKETMTEQLKERQLTIAQQKAEEEAQLRALRELNERQSRIIAEEDARLREEDKAYLERVRQTNLRELANKKQAAQEQALRDQQLASLVATNNKHRAEMDEMRQKNATMMLKKLNEEAHSEFKKRADSTQKQDAEEMARLVEHDRLMAAQERAAELDKKQRFKEEFDAAVTRDKAYRSRYNYDEPQDVTRRRNELAAQSYKLLRQEEELRKAQQRAEYEQELMDQIAAKQQWQMTHLDGI